MPSCRLLLQPQQTVPLFLCDYFSWEFSPWAGGSLSIVFSFLGQEPRTDPLSQNRGLCLNVLPVEGRSARDFLPWRSFFIPGYHLPLFQGRVLQLLAVLFPKGRTPVPSFKFLFPITRFRRPFFFFYCSPWRPLFTTSSVPSGLTPVPAGPFPRGARSPPITGRLALSTWAPKGTRAFCFWSTGGVLVLTPLTFPSQFRPPTPPVLISATLGGSDGVFFSPPWDVEAPFLTSGTTGGPPSPGSRGPRVGGVPPFFFSPGVRPSPSVRISSLRQVGPWQTVKPLPLPGSRPFRFF